MTKYITDWAETTKTGPNDASGVIWALSEYFFTFLRFFLMLTNALLYICVLKTKRATDWLGTTKTGPNNARHVVWVLSEFFFFFWY